MEFLFLGLLCLSSTVIALVVINKMPNHDSLITKITLVLREEISKINSSHQFNTTDRTMKQFGKDITQRVIQPDEIKMDESVIPTKMEIETRGSNLANATTETKVVDKDLKTSKNKLKSIFQKKEQ